MPPPGEKIDPRSSKRLNRGVDFSVVVSLRNAANNRAALNIVRLARNDARAQQSCMIERRTDHVVPKLVAQCGGIDISCNLERFPGYFEAAFIIGDYGEVLCP